MRGITTSWLLALLFMASACTGSVEKNDGGQDAVSDADGDEQPCQANKRIIMSLFICAPRVKA
jgi:hypothetical protein